MGPRSMLPATVAVLVLVCAMLALSPATVALVGLSAGAGALAATYTVWRLMPAPVQRLVALTVRQRVDELRRG